MQACTVIPPLSNSDHNGLFFTLSALSSRKVQKSRVVWRYDLADWEGASERLANTDWYAVLNTTDIDLSWAAWRDYFLTTTHG